MRAMAYALLAFGLAFAAACGSDDDNGGAGEADTNGGQPDGSTADIAGVDTTNPDTSTPDPDTGEASDGSITDTGGNPLPDASADTGLGDTGLGDTGEGGADTELGDGGDITEPECSPDSAAGLAGCVDADEYSTELEFIAKARPTGTAHSLVVREHLATKLTELGYVVELDPSPGAGVNVIGTRQGKTAPGEVVMISAHYDSVPLCAGADDNGSAVAGALEAARVLAMAEHDRTLVVAFWDEEERGLVGSWAWMRLAVDAGHKFVVHFVLEMIGYKSDEPGSQSLPTGFDFAFPAAAKAVADNDGKGDFIALITDTKAKPYADLMQQYATTVNHRVLDVAVSDFLIQSNLIGDLKRSDHTPSWGFGVPAMMITDTANFRNAGYHCSAAADSIDRLDTEFATKTIAATVFAAAQGLSSTGPTAAVPPVDLIKCNLATNEGCAQGQKCAATIEQGGWYAAKCLALTPEVVGDGEICIRPNNVVGEDNCDVGLFCAFWGMPLSNPQLRICSPTCITDADCEAGRKCTSPGPSIPSHGVCLKSCNPFEADSCAENLNCVLERTSTSRKLDWICTRIGTGQEGSPCVPQFDDCQKGLSCGYSMADGEARCGKPCDDEHPCPAGKTCQVQINTSAAVPGSGTCH